MEREDTVRDGPEAEGDSGQTEPKVPPWPSFPPPQSSLGPTDALDSEAWRPGGALGRPEETQTPPPGRPSLPHTSPPRAESLSWNPRGDSLRGSPDPGLPTVAPPELVAQQIPGLQRHTHPSLPGPPRCAGSARTVWTWTPRWGPQGRAMVRAEPQSGVLSLGQGLGSQRMPTGLPAPGGQDRMRQPTPFPRTSGSLPGHAFLFPRPRLPLPQATPSPFPRPRLPFPQATPFSSPRPGPVGSPTAPASCPALP